jgi:hypothetical protein
VSAVVAMCADCLDVLAPPRPGHDTPDRHLDGTPQCMGEQDGQRRLAVLSGQDPEGVPRGRAA